MRRVGVRTQRLVFLPLCRAQSETERLRRQEVPRQSEQTANHPVREPLCVHVFRHHNISTGLLRSTRILSR